MAKRPRFFPFSYYPHNIFKNHTDLFLFFPLFLLFLFFSLLSFFLSPSPHLLTEHHFHPSPPPSTTNLLTLAGQQPSTTCRPLDRAFYLHFLSIWSRLPPPSSTTFSHRWPYVRVPFCNLFQQLLSRAFGCWICDP